MLQPIPERRGFVGVAVGERETAVAFVKDGQARYTLLHLRHVRDPMRKQHRFREVLIEELRHPAKGLALAYNAGTRSRPLIIAQREIARQVARDRGVNHSEVTSRNVRRKLISRPGRVTNRELLGVVAERFGLIRMQQVRTETLTGRATPATSAERLLQRAALAIAAAVTMKENASPQSL